jgi:prolyl 4-hydroxylase
LAAGIKAESFHEFIRFIGSLIHMKKETYGAGIFTISNFLSPVECKKYIQLSEEIGYDLAAIQTTEGPKFIETIRNNDRVIFDNMELADYLFARAKDFLPSEIEGWHIDGLNERWRFYRYSGEQYFKWHKDGFYERSENEVSLLAFIIYLNDEFEGGETQFSWEWIKPETGMVLVFPHRVVHQGASLISGAKYVLRSDVMYKKPL